MCYYNSVVKITTLYILIFRNESEIIMIKEIKNVNDVQGYVFRHDKEDMLIHYEERKRGEGSKPEAVYAVPSKVLIVLDKTIERKDLKEFIEYLQSIKLPTNDIRYM